MPHDPVAYEYEPNPRIEERRAEGPTKVADEHVGFNGRLASMITRGVGTMWAFYLVALLMGLWMGYAGKHLFGDPYPYALMLLIFGGILQMLLMIAIMVGQQVLGSAADRRASQTYSDAEAILAECQKLQAHLSAQDRALGEALRGAGSAGGPGARSGA